jgi:tetratricopeptide (TPR) repeat protein
VRLFSDRISQRQEFRLSFSTVWHDSYPSPRLLGALLLLLAAPTGLRAQSSVTPSAGGKSDSKGTQDFSREPAVFEYMHASMRYENDGTGTREMRARLRVQTQAGLASGQLIFPYNALNEQMEIRSVKVLKPDGSVVTAGADAVQDLSSPVAREAPMYTDARQKHVTVPRVSVGDVVEYDVVITATPLVAGQFWQIWNFSDRIIALNEQLDLNVPSNRTLKIRSSEGIEPTISTEGDRRIYHWATSNLKTPPPIDIFKDFKFDVIKLLEGTPPPPPPRVMFSTFQSWAEVANWYGQLERDRRVPTPEIRAKADEIAHGLQTDDHKAQALYYWVSQNIRYVSLSFGLGRYQPHAAAEVLANGYGDCKDKTALLEAMLEAEGLHAHPVLANTLLDIDPEMPNPSQFDHAFTFLRVGDKDMWLDTTVGVGPYGYLMPQLRGKEALVVSDTNSAGLRETPKDFPLTVEYRIGINGKVDAEGNLDATVELQSRGDLEVLIRLLNDHVSQEQLAKSADTVLSKANRLLYGKMQYTDFKVVNASDMLHAVKAQFHATGKLMYVNPKKESLAELTTDITSVPIGQWHLLSLLPAADSKSNPDGKSQQSPIDLKGPRSYSLDLNLTFPNLTVSDAPPAKEFRITQDFAEYRSRDSWEGTTFHGSRSLDLRVPIIPPSDSKAYVAFVQKIVEATAIAPETKSTSKAAATKSIPPDAMILAAPTASASPSLAPAKSQTSEVAHAPAAETQELYDRGTEEAKRKNWANAIEAFGSAVKADPQYPDAWRELGRAHMNARQFQDAEAAFRKYLELAPDDRLAYVNMAWALSNERKYQEEEDLLVKRIAAAPTDGDALFRLGTAYLALHQPQQAVPVLERSTARLPQYVAAHFALGRAYLETHQDALALETFRTVLTLDDSESRMNGVAYILAEHSSSLDIAETWSQRSIEVIERELNDTSLANLPSQTWTRVTRLSEYWDTMGWIKYQQGKMNAAEKYILAAWQIADDFVIGTHLGRIYETLGRKNDAAEMYLAALNTIPPEQSLNDDFTEIRKRLSDIVGGDEQLDDQLAQARKKKSPWRMVSIADPDGTQGIAQYTVIIDANSKVVDLAATSSDDPLSSLNDAVRAAVMPETFPDDTLRKLPRLSTLSCTGSNQPCTFTLLTAKTASRLAPVE